MFRVVLKNLKRTFERNLGLSKLTLEPAGETEHDPRPPEFDSTQLIGIDDHFDRGDCFVKVPLPLKNESIVQSPVRIDFRGKRQAR
jgi:hypothetical protein